MRPGQLHRSADGIETAVKFIRSQVSCAHPVGAIASIVDEEDDVPVGSPHAGVASVRQADERLWDRLAGEGRDGRPIGNVVAGVVR